MDDREVDEIREELTDRYGFLPPVVNDLMEMITFKNFLRGFLVSCLDYNGKEIIVTFHPHAKGPLEKILALIKSNAKRFRLSPELKLSIGFKARNGKEVISEVKKLLQ